MEEKLQWKLYYIVNEDLAFKKSYFYVMRVRPMRSNWRKDHLLATIERVKQIACCPILRRNVESCRFIHQIYRTIKNDISDFYLYCQYYDVISSPKPLEPEYIYDCWEYRVLLSWNVLDQNGNKYFKTIFKGTSFCLQLVWSA